MTIDALALPVVPPTATTEAPSLAEGLPIVSGQPATPSGDCCHSGSAVSAPVHSPDGHTCSNPSAAGVSTIEVPNAEAAAEEPDDATLIDALRTVIDPELMINIVDLGLVYSINHTDRKVLVEMTLTSPACPAGPQIISQAKMALEKIGGVDTAEIKLTMSPPWTPDRMTDDARDQLGIF